MECLNTWVQLGYRGMSTDMGHWWSIHWGQNAEPLKLQVTGTFGFFWFLGQKDQSENWISHGGHRCICDASHAYHIIVQCLAHDGNPNYNK